MRRALERLLLAFSIAAVLVLTLYPFSFRAGWFYYSEWTLFEYAHMAEPIGNVLLFVPVGLFSAIVWARDRSMGATLLVAQMLGTSISLAVEVLQMFLPRQPSVLDVLTNSLGTAIGLGIWAVYRIRWQRARGVD